MEGWQILFSNYYINVAFVAWLTAQILKTLLTLFIKKELILERMVGAGGMPSAHSALVVSLTVAIERKMGFSSAEFALALAFAAIVMYDAMGVRRAAGEQAKVLNKMIDSMSWNVEMFVTEKTKFLQRFFHSKHSEAEEVPSPPSEKLFDPQKANEEGKALLKEFLGHTPVEVFAGAILGIVVAYIMPVQ